MTIFWKLMPIIWGCLLFNSISWAENDAETTLTKDVAAFEKKHGHFAASALLTDRLSADTLNTSADILRAKGHCRIAYKVRIQAFHLGLADSSEHWYRLAEDASCAQMWEKGSLAAALSLQYAQTDMNKLKAQSLLGYLLESRNTWYTDWKPLAMLQYQQVLDNANIPWVKKRWVNMQKLALKKKHLRITDSSANKQGNSAALCLTFNDSLTDNKNIHYEDYLIHTPSFKASYKVSGSSICIQGAEYGKRYEVLVRQGLSTENKRLADNQTVKIQTGNRDASVWFKRSAYVLPLHQPANIPLYNLNTEKVQVSLFRIDERNILSSFVQRKFQRRLDGGDINTLQDHIGEKIWTFEEALTTEKNQTHIHALSLDSKLINQPGLYVLLAKDDKDQDDYWSNYATQWLVVSDIGLSSYQASDGLSLVARSLKTAKPLLGVRVSLLAKNNDVLAEKVTDQQGQVVFDPGLLRGKKGQTAVQITAYSQLGGFSFLSLLQPAFDLSDRGVGGKQAKGALDAWLYTERGVYRPSESVHLTTLLRDSQAKAVSGLPLTLRLLNPQGNIVSEQLLNQDLLGGYQQQIQLSDNAKTGRWQAQVFLDTQEAALGSYSFLVEMVAPPRMEAKLTAHGALSAEHSLVAELSADYLFGAPVANRPVNGMLLIEQDPQPFPDFLAYQFGRANDDYKTLRFNVDEQKTDAQGKAKLPIKMPDIGLTHQPLLAKIYAEVMDVDGRKVSAQHKVPIHHLPFYIGIKGQFSQQAKANEKAQFDIVALNHEQNLQTQTLNWQLIEQDIDYQWFEKNGDWHYERVVTDNLMQQGEVQLSAQHPATLAIPVAQGSYRLAVFNAEKTVISSINFHAGDQVHSESDAPDAVSLSLNKASYLAGDVAVLNIDAPYRGEMSLTIASDKIHQMQNISMSTQQHSLEIPIDADWGAGAYALVSVFKPDEKTGEGVKRALGIIWLNIDATPRTLEVVLHTPDTVQPRQTIQLPVTIEGSQGKEVYLTLAAVDEGVLNLTGFSSPDPVKHFFGKRQLGTQLRDIYGKLIQPILTSPQQRSGGGSSSRRGMPASNIDIVSLFSGIVKPDAQGKLEIPLELPDYNGRLRLMAVAWSEHKVGASQAKLPVVDPLVVQSSLPRFMALGDVSELTVSIHNINAQAGEYKVSVIANEGVKSMVSATRLVELKQGDQAQVTLALKAHALGDHPLKLRVTGQGFSYEKSFNMGVRGQYLPLVERQYHSLAAGESLSIKPDQFTHLLADDLNVKLYISSQSGLDVPSILKQLDLYPHGCLEQLTSRALPLLYWQDLANQWGLAAENGIPERIQVAIDKILQNQLANGGFSLWGNGYEADKWPSVYALDFLIRARKKGFIMNDFFYDRGISWLERQAKILSMNNAEDLSILPYVHYVLAQAGKGQAENVRYLADTQQANIPTLLANAQLAAALHVLGDEKRAEKIFSLAIKQNKREIKWQDYGSRLRDLAATMSLLNETNSLTDKLAGLMAELVFQQQQNDWLSTQEKAWLVMAARQLSQPTPVHVQIDDQAVKSDKTSLSIEADPEKTTIITNKGLKPLWLTSTHFGTPKTLMPPKEKYFDIERSWYDLKGDPVNPEEVKQGDILIALIQGVSHTGKHHQAMLVDLIPSGFELENPKLLNGLGLDAFDWLPELSNTRYVEVLDDRYIAALDITAKKESTFTLAYILRAVVAGQYSLPAVEIEDMYRPKYRATGDVAKVNIQAIK